MNRSFNPLHLVNTYGAFGSVTRVRQRDRAGGHRRGAGRPGDGMARVRVQGQAGRCAAAATAVRALPPAAGLADVVRRALPGLHPRLVRTPRRPAAGERPGDLAAAAAPTRSRTGHRRMCARCCTATASPRGRSGGRAERGGTALGCGSSCRRCTPCPPPATARKAPESPGSRPYAPAPLRNPFLDNMHSPHIMPNALGMYDAYLFRHRSEESRHGRPPAPVPRGRRDRHARLRRHHGGDHADAGHPAHRRAAEDCCTPPPRTPPG